MTVVLYEAHLEHVDPEEPLWGVPYFGQIVRSGTADANFAARKREHENDAAREEKDIGLHAVIDPFGRDALEWRIVSSQSGRRTAMQTLANAEEIRLIDEHGGVLRDMDKKRTQTLNLTKGGQGDARAVWEGIDARRQRSLTKFKMEMEAYVEEYGSSLVPFVHTTVEGYHLGHSLSHFRKGSYRIGMPREKEITAWAEALPCWEWKAVKAAANVPERLEQNRECTKDWWKNASDKDRAERVSKMTDGQNRPERLEANAEKATQWWKNASVTTKETRAAKQLKSLKRQREENPEKEANRLAKMIETHDKKYQARLEGLAPKERKKAESLHGMNVRARKKREVELKLLRTVMPDAMPKDVTSAKREGRMPEAAK